MKWNNITLKQYLEIQKVSTSQLTDFDKTKQLIAIMCGRDINHIPITEAGKYLQELKALLNTPIPQGKIHKEYTLNGNKYSLNSKIENITTAQFWDFTEYSKTPTQNMAKMLSCFLIPKGKEYGETDIDQVLADLECLPIVDVNTIAFFLLTKFRKLQRTILVYSMLATMENMKPRTIWKRCKLIIKACRNMDYLTMY